jgi:hypothetical protein
MIDIKISLIIKKHSDFGGSLRKGLWTISALGIIVFGKDGEYGRKKAGSL